MSNQPKRMAHAKLSKIMPFNCKHDYQDSKHGTGMRVHNPKKEDKWACTVCGNVKS